jgi:hypothetical protein
VVTVNFTSGCEFTAAVAKKKNVDDGGVGDL